MTGSPHGGFEVQDGGYAATTLAQTNLRSLIGDKSLDESLTARDTIKPDLRNVLDAATNTWGVKVARVEVQKIDPPADITEAMSRQMKAEGVKQSNLKAEGDAQVRITPATAEAKAIDMVSNAAGSYFEERAEVSKKLDVLNTVLAYQTKFIVPAGSDLVNVLGLDDKSVVSVRKSARPARGRLKSPRQAPASSAHRYITFRWPQLPGRTEVTLVRQNTIVNARSVDQKGSGGRYR